MEAQSDNHTLHEDVITLLVSLQEVVRRMRLLTRLIDTPTFGGTLQVVRVTLRGMEAALRVALGTVRRPDENLK